MRQSLSLDTGWEQALTSKQNSALDSLECALSETPPNEWKEVIMKKNKMLTLRVSESEKSEISTAAKQLDLSVAEYLMALHICAKRVLSRKAAGLSR